VHPLVAAANQDPHRVRPPLFVHPPTAALDCQLRVPIITHGVVAAIVGVPLHRHVRLPIAICQSSPLHDGVAAVVGVPSRRRAITVGGSSTSMLHCKSSPSHCAAAVTVYVTATAAKGPLPVHYQLPLPPVPLDNR
jgi:hypothetical protein